VSYSCFCNSRWSNFSWNICGHKLEAMWCAGLKICMGDECHHRYYKRIKFCQNPRGNLTISCWIDMEWPYYYWVECLHLVRSRARETRNTSTAYWVKQTVLIYIAIHWVECLHIAACWRDTQLTHCGIYCDSLKMEQTVFVIAIEWSICT